MSCGRRVCECLLFVLFVDYGLVAAKPFFGGRMWCDLFCDDDDDVNVSTPSTTTSLEDALDALFDPCTDCPTRRPPTAFPPMMPNGMPMPPGMMPNGMMPNGVMPNGMMPGGMNGPMQPFNFMIPPSNGMNLTMTPNSFGSWFMNIVPWGATPGTPNQASTPPPATTAAGATTAAPATTAAGATTAAPTTAAG